MKKKKSALSFVRIKGGTTFYKNNAPPPPTISTTTTTPRTTTTTTSTDATKTILPLDLPLPQPRPPPTPPSMVMPNNNNNNYKTSFSTTTTTTTTTTATMPVVLAELFVQQKFREINEMEATTTMNSARPPSLNYSETKVAPTAPVCYCNSTTSTTSHPATTNISTSGTDTKIGNVGSRGKPQHDLRLPLSVASEPECYYEVKYALRERRWRLSHGGDKGGLGRPVSTKMGDVGLLDEPELDGNFQPIHEPLPTVDNDSIHDLGTYTNSWRAILQTERRQELLLYEQYSQFNTIIAKQPEPFVPIKASTGAMGSNQQHGAARATQEYAVPSPPVPTFVRITIKGIADAKPPPKPGDIVLIRPIKHLALPFDWQNPLTCPWTPPSHLVEIVSHVTNVVRYNPYGSNPKNSNNDEGPPSSSHTHKTQQGDQLVAAWVDRHTDRNILGPACRGGSRYNIRIIPSNKYYRNCLTALDWVQTISESIMLPLLFPKHAPQLKEGSSISAMTQHIVLPSQLNHTQASFIRVAMARTLQPSMDAIRGPLILTGPAGTGKTKTLLLAILKILEHTAASLASSHRDINSTGIPRILVCTPSHTAANVIAERLAKSGSLGPSQLFRLLDADRPVETIPSSILPYCHQNPITGAFSLPPDNQLLHYRVIVSTCADANILYCVGLTNQQIRHRRQCFETYCRHECQRYGMQLQPGSMMDDVNAPHFTHFFLDEAAQATEPESLIPLSVVVDPDPGAAKVEIALVGDPRQLSPSVYSTRAAQAGLERSWMERLLQRPVSCLLGTAAAVVTDNPHGTLHPTDNNNMLGPPLLQMNDWLRYSLQREGQEELSFFLTLNYRGHVSFLMVPSALFYSDRLQRAGYEKMTGYQQEDEETQWCERLRSVEALSDPFRLPPSTTGITILGVPPDWVGQQKQFHWPIHFCGVIGMDTSASIESGFSADSWSNMEEAEAVTQIIVTLALVQGVPIRKIGVMAPFRGQVGLIRRLLRAKQLSGVNVGTIEDYQSVERDVIVLSLTRSSPSFLPIDQHRRVGAFGQPKRANVALTRAEHLMIVVRCNSFDVVVVSIPTNKPCASDAGRILSRSGGCVVARFSRQHVLVRLFSFHLIFDCNAGWKSPSHGRRLCVAPVFVVLSTKWVVVWSHRRV
jgi:hypothetical protein